MAVLDKTRNGKAATPLPVDGQRLLLHDVPWKAYRLLGDLLDERNLHLTYDEGRLEIMPLSLEHERGKCVLRMIVDVLGEELDVPLRSYGSASQQRGDLQKGLEPDQCYYSRHRRAVARKKRLDLRRDPPPDLALEVDITHSSLDRLAIYAQLGVPEIWRYDGSILEFLILGQESYQVSETSPTFPGIRSDQLLDFVTMGQNMDDGPFRRK